MSQMDTIEERTLSKVKWRLAPYVCLLFFIAYIDRTNLGYAALEMNKDLGISAVAYGALTSVFYLPYFLFEIPSNMLLNRYGARRWLARIMITWGIVTCLAMFVHNYLHIAAVRFFLGMMEAGFLPGVMFYYTLWLPQRERAKAVALFYLAIPISTIIGAPVAGWILDHAHFFGYSGWRWLFMIEGIPAIIVGFCTLFYLTDRPSEAKWLAEEERGWLTEELKKEDIKKKEARHLKLKDIFANLRTWRLGIIYAFLAIPGSGINFFLPMVIKDFSKASNTSVGFLMMIPPVFAAAIMVLLSRHSDKTGERKYHTSAAAACGLVGLLLAALAPSPVVKMIGIILGVAAVYSVMPPFWALVGLSLTGSAAAVGMAIISSCNAFGSFLGGFGAGYMQSISSNAVLAYYGVCYVIALILLLTLRVRREEKIVTEGTATG